MTIEEETLENLRCEYSEVNNNFRHYSALRFAAFSAHLVALCAVMAVAFAIVGGFGWISGRQRFFWAKIVGILLALVFFAFEIFCELNIRHLRNVASKLEELLGLSQFRMGSFSVMSWISYFIWGIYILVILFWLIVG